MVPLNCSMSLLHLLLIAALAPAIARRVQVKLVAHLAPYPGYAGLIDAKGTVIVTQNNDNIKLEGTLAGLESSATGGVHIHEGFTCDTSGGHYYADLFSDPWTTVYKTNSMGVASLNFRVAGLSLHDSRPVAGRTVVVHSSSGSRVACGVLVPTSGEVIKMGAYPDFSGTLVSGTLVLEDATYGVRVIGTLGGLEPSVDSGGIHIHSGFSCDHSLAVGGHYMGDLDFDPWLTTTYASDESGAATISLLGMGLTLHGANPAAFRTLVVHQRDGSVKSACGVVGVAPRALALLTKYPQYPGSLEASGTLVLREATSGSLGPSIVLEGTLTGLERSSTGGIHIHEGFSCASSGKHYFRDKDPWTTTYTSDANGGAKILLELGAFTIADKNHHPVAGRAVVVHDSNSNRIACGLLVPTDASVVRMNRYPGLNLASANTAYGTVVVNEDAGGVKVAGTLANLEANLASAGVHIHSGYSCDDSSAVGGHFQGDLGDDPWSSTRYQTNSGGGADLAVKGANLTLRTGSNAVDGRTMVVHDSSGDKVSCGVLSGGYSKAVAHLSPYPGYAGALNVKGTMVVTEIGGGIKLEGTLAGLEASAAGGVHIHEGFACATSGGHYFAGLAADPWATRYKADQSGVAPVSLWFDDFVLHTGERPVVGRAVVVHDASGARVACGLLAPTNGEVVSMGPYPGFLGDNSVVGTLVVEDTATGLSVSGTIGGLEASVGAGGIHVHSGVTCNSKLAVGGHFKGDLSIDPWLTTTYASDASGAASVSILGDGISLRMANSAAYRTVVVHQRDGSVRSGCGVIGATPLAVLGGRSGSDRGSDNTGDDYGLGFGSGIGIGAAIGLAIGLSALGFVVHGMSNSPKAKNSTAKLPNTKFDIEANVTTLKVSAPTNVPNGTSFRNGLRDHK